MMKFKGIARYREVLCYTGITTQMAFFEKIFDLNKEEIYVNIGTHWRHCKFSSIPQQESKSQSFCWCGDLLSIYI